jgi:hypothetical protein
LTTSKSLKEELKEARAEVQRINTKNKPHVAKLAGLNLESLPRACACISSHTASKDIGPVVDPHTGFKNFYANMSGGEFLKNFERVHKLHISSLAQGYSMSSFEQAIPKVLSKVGSVVIKELYHHLDQLGLPPILDSNSGSRKNSNISQAGNREHSRLSGISGSIYHAGVSCIE